MIRVTGFKNLITRTPTMERKRRGKTNFVAIRLIKLKSG